MFSFELFVFALAVAGASLSGATEVSSSAGAPTVKLTQGSLRGEAGRSADGTTFYKFLGIPYAKPPVGNLRFAAPQEPASWSGVRDATKFGHMCIQDSATGTSEDCLYLNVYTPHLPTGTERAALLPVMVAIHGGAFVAGSGNIGPGQLIDHGVVVVSINYRLNVFGFMSIEGTDAPGNAGLKDQVAALKWVKKNIAHFGGNPNSVTIFGMSAGGAAVHYLILSSLAKGLFHRAISESGCALSTFAFNHNNQQYAFELSKLVGKPATTSSQLVKNLREVAAAELLKELPKVTHPKPSTRPFVPCIEFARTGEQPFLRQSPTTLVERGVFNYVPYIIGSAKREVAAFYSDATLTSQSYWQNIERNPEGYLVPAELGLKQGSEKSKEVAEKVKKFYFGNSAISYQTREKWISVQTDIQFTIGIVNTIRAHAKHSTSHTYNYYLTYGAATHGMEWQYVVYNGPVKGQTSSAARFARSLGEYWTSFAKTGVPTAAGEVTWKPVSTSSYPYLDLNVPNTLKTDVEKQQIDFWTQIYKQYRNGTGAR
ncbi:fatty acyl-CoA hydrolase precursor, medium chain-like [Bacillus rossius redtenbacheri]|uniref:fatty acyl-CoA hydrolase precursor, medium chain-like n=1 Tax=Bacillus rossius redtenbacheri TaxID=93214 RepID=UPI002FDDA675